MDTAAPPSCEGAGCHEDMPSGEDLHARVTRSSCELCHVPAGDPAEHGFRLTATDGGVCTSCHPPRADSEHVHAPFQQRSCLVCHDPHGHGSRIAMVRDDVEAKCRSCHEAQPKDDRAHGPFAKGECLSCHAPHRSEFTSLARAHSSDLCLGCHDREIDSADGVKTIANIAEVIRGAPFKHGPIRNGECNGCHFSHVSPNAYLLHDSFPREFYQDYDESHYALCFQCHPSDFVLQERTTELTNFRDGDRNLHFLHVNSENGRSCRACHEVHASRLPFHIRESVPYGQWELPVRFRQTERGGTCESGCHKEVAYDNGGASGRRPANLPPPAR